MNGTENQQRLHKRLKAAIGYWTDYYYGRMSRTVFFIINGHKISLSYNEKTQFFQLGYKWLYTPVFYEEIFDTLDLYEELLIAAPRGEHNVGIN